MKIVCTNIDNTTGHNPKNRSDSVQSVLLNLLQVCWTSM